MNTTATRQEMDYPYNPASLDYQAGNMTTGGKPSAPVPEVPDVSFYSPEESKEVNAFQLPMWASASDELLPSDDPSMYAFRGSNGTYFVPAYSQDQSLPERRSVAEAGQHLAESIPSVSDVATSIRDAIVATVKAPTNPNATLGDVAGLAGGMGAGGAGLRAANVLDVPEDALGMFIGGKGATNEQLQRGLRARELEERGYTPHEIWYDTMWMRGTDGQWRTELPDDRFGLSPAAQRFLFNDGHVDGPDVLVTSNNSYTQAYPNREDNLLVDVAGKSDGETYDGYFDGRNIVARPDSGTRISDIEDTLLHEFQHGAQRAEGFEGGYNPQSVSELAKSLHEELPPVALDFIEDSIEAYNRTIYADLLQDYLDNPNGFSWTHGATVGNNHFPSAEQAFLERLIGQTPVPPRIVRDMLRVSEEQKYTASDRMQEFANKNPELHNRTYELLDFIVRGNTPEGALAMYQRNAGEAEARLTEQRRHLTEEQRWNVFPEVRDVPQDELWTKPQLNNQVAALRDAIAQYNGVTGLYDHMLGPQK